MENRHTSRDHRQLAWLLLVVVALRGLVPAGFMPAFDARGGTAVSMQVCPMTGTLMAMPAHQVGGRHGSDPAPKSNDAHFCGFAATATAAPLPCVAGPALVVDSAIQPQHVVTSLVYIHSIDPAYSPRAPPLQA